MLSVDASAELLEKSVGRLSNTSARAMILCDAAAGDRDMLIDDYLQAMLIEGQALPAEDLAIIEDTVLHAGFDPQLIERTLSWIQQHRELGRRPEA